MLKQYIVQKYVMANSVKEALEKSKKLPIHEVFVHAGWLEKIANQEWTTPKPNGLGFKEKK